LDAMLDKAQRQTARMRTSRDRAVARQLRLLFEAFGHMKYTPSEPLLRKYIPVTSPFLPDIRAAAIWALGYLHAGSPQPDLVRLLSGRLADVFSEVPESDLVRETSAVSLGRMKAAGALPVLRRFGEGETVRSRVGYACGWAIHQITGEPLPKPVTVAISPMDWFLVPIE
jgi:HEAT repeat protein